MYKDMNIAILRKQKNDGYPTTHCPTNKGKEKNEFSQQSPQKTQQEKSGKN